MRLGNPRSIPGWAFALVLALGLGLGLPYGAVAALQDDTDDRPHSQSVTGVPGA